MHPLRSVAEAWRRNSSNDLPAQVSVAAEGGDPLMQRALQLWLEAYGQQQAILPFMNSAQEASGLAGAPHQNS